MRQGVGSGRGPRRSERGTAAKRSPARRATPDPRLDETSADGWRLLVEYEPDSYETTSAYALFHF